MKNMNKEIDWEEIWNKERPVPTKDKGDVFTLNKFIEYLNSIGITNNKSITLNVTKWFERLEDKEQWAFLRGVIDGDGCFTFFISQRIKRGNCTIVSGSKEFTNMIKQFLGDKAHIFIKTPYKNSGNKSINYIITINCANVPKILYKLYENMDIDSDLYLKRKYESYKIIENYYKEM
jgi:intein/homing endonuclease